MIKIQLDKRTKRTILLSGIVIVAIAIIVLITGYWGNYSKVVSINLSKNKVYLETDKGKTYKIADSGNLVKRKYTKDLTDKKIKVDFNTFKIDISSYEVYIKKNLIGNIRYKTFMTEDTPSTGDMSNVEIEYKDGKINIISTNAKKLVDKFYLNKSTGDFSLKEEKGLEEVKLNDDITSIELGDGSKVSVIASSIGSHLSELFEYTELEKLE